MMFCRGKLGLEILQDENTKLLKSSRNFLRRLGRPRARSVIFVCPDYHCSFIYRDELRKLGWIADVYVPMNYPKELLFSTADIKLQELEIRNLQTRLRYRFDLWLTFFRCLVKYQYHVYYGRLDHFNLLDEHNLSVFRYFKSSFRINLFLTRLFGRRVIYVPSGTPDEVSIETLQLLGNREEGVQTEDSCSNLIHLKTVRRYSHVNVGFGFNHTKEFEQIHFQYKCLDLERWRPSIEIPDNFRLTRKNPDSIWILHSFMFAKERQELQGGNIKGTKYVVDAVKRLQDDGFNVELMMFDKIPSKDYIYIQAQADIVVEELIRGAWGSTAVECLALGKPVLTYIRKEWEQKYLETFPWIRELPVLSTDKISIYENLKNVVTSDRVRLQMSANARQFALENFDVKKNVIEFKKILLSLT